MDYKDSATGEANEELAIRLAKDRNDWKIKISNLVGLLKEVRNLAECQVNMLSYRQILLDKITDFKTTKQIEAYLAGNSLPYSQEEFKQIADHKQLLRDQINDLEGS